MANYDDLIISLDNKDIRSILKDYSQQVEKGLKLTNEMSFIEEINRIVIVGMGDSAIPGYLLKQYLKDIHIPVTIVEDYELPNFIDKDNLIICISYSGNDEETINAYRQAKRFKLKTICITTGGKLKEICDFNKDKIVNIPKIYHQKTSNIIIFFSILRLLENSKILDSLSEDIKKLRNVLKKTDFEDMGKNLALRIQDKSPIIYSSKKLNHIAEKWKQDFIDNTNQYAYLDTIPNLCHKEIKDYNVKPDKVYGILLKDSEEFPRINKSFDIVKKDMKDKGCEVTELIIKGDNYLIRLISCLIIGDYTSFYLAIINEKEPFLMISEEKYIEMMKK